MEIRNGILLRKLFWAGVRKISYFSKFEGEGKEFEIYETEAYLLSSACLKWIFLRRHSIKNSVVVSLKSSTKNRWCKTSYTRFLALAKTRRVPEPKVVLTKELVYLHQLKRWLEQIVGM